MQKLTIQQVENLRRDAKKLGRAEGITHSQALDRLAQDHGFKNWSLLQKNGVFDIDSPRLSDLIPDGYKPPQPRPAEGAGGLYLLRFLEGAPVALYRSRSDSHAEVVPTRRDLFNYVGGFGWGYSGSGAQNLSYAIVGKLFENDRLSRSELSSRALRLLENKISRLTNDQEYELTAEELRAAVIEEPAE